MRRGEDAANPSDLLTANCGAPLTAISWPVVRRREAECSGVMCQVLGTTCHVSSYKCHVGGARLWGFYSTDVRAGQYYGGI